MKNLFDVDLTKVKLHSGSIVDKTQGNSKNQKIRNVPGEIKKIYKSYTSSSAVYYTKSGVYAIDVTILCYRNKNEGERPLSWESKEHNELYFLVHGLNKALPQGYRKAEIKVELNKDIPHRVIFHLTQLSSSRK